MNHAQFHAAIKAVAAGRYFSTVVDVSSQTDGQTVVRFKVYIDGRSWIGEFPTAEMAVAAAAGREPTVESLGDLPAPSDGASS